MADAITPRLNLVKPEVGGSADTWGDKWNENADKIDAAIIKPDEENVWSAPQHFDGGLYDRGERVVRQSDIEDVVRQSDIEDVVRTSRTISTGTGLTGGGDLSANRTISLASSHWPIGVGQTWQDVTNQRLTGVNYTNTTGRTIFVAVMYTSDSSTPGLELVVDGKTITNFVLNGPYTFGTASGLVPPGSIYRIERLGGGQGIYEWMELR